LDNVQKKKVLGPAMIPEKKMLRYHEEIGFYELIFPAETIEHYRNKFHSNKKENNISIEHKLIIKKGVELTDSFLINKENSHLLPIYFQDLPNGTWMMEYTFDNSNLLSKFENDGSGGFSIEVKFTIVVEDGNKYDVYEKFSRMNKLSDLLSIEIWVHGGSTDGKGRNEHGEAHFELKEKNSRKPLGKIMMPSLNLWLQSSFKEKIKLMVVQNGDEITKKDKKGLVRWLELNDNENLIKCHKEWNESNKHNNRTFQI